MTHRRRLLRGAALELAAIVASGLLLPGCPLTDRYSLEPAAGRPGSGAEQGGPGASGGTGELHASGGTTASGGLPEASGGAGTDAQGGTATTSTGGDSTGATPGTGGSGDASSDGGTGAEAGAPSGEAGAPCDPSPEVCDGRDNDCNDAIDDGDICGAGCAGRLFGGHLYLLCVFETPMTYVGWNAATMRCRSARANLGLSVDLDGAWIESSDENDFLKQWIADTVPSSKESLIWMGANDIAHEGTWIWGRGDEFFVEAAGGGGSPYMDRFNDWGPGRPSSAVGVDEDCGAFDSSAAWTWNDIRCTEPKQGFVCEQTD